MPEKKPWLYRIWPCRTISEGGNILGIVYSRKTLTLTVEECFEVVCSDPEEGKLFELGTFATAEQAQKFLDAHEKWRRHPEAECEYCSASYPLDEPTPEDVAVAIS